MSYTAIDLSQLPAPDVVEVIDFETILAEMVADLRERDPAFDAMVESDPAYKILEVAAYREVLLRQRINDSCYAVMLAYAAGTDLEQFGAPFGVTRQVIGTDEDGNLIYEDDESLRRRISLSLEGLSVAGPEGAYVFHALSADPRVLDASVHSPEPGDVVVTIMSRHGSGQASGQLVREVDRYLSQDNIRPITDNVLVESVEVVEFEVIATLYTYPGPDSQVVLEEAENRLTAYVEEIHRIGVDVPLSGIYGALHVNGVQRVELEGLDADIEITGTQVSYCTAINITYGGPAT